MGWMIPTDAVHLCGLCVSRRTTEPACQNGEHVLVSIYLPTETLSEYPGRVPDKYSKPPVSTDLRESVSTVLFDT